MSKLAEIKQKISEKIAPLTERIFGKRAPEGEEPKKENFSFSAKKLRAAYTEGSTSDRVIVLLVMIAIGFGIFSFYHASKHLLAKKHLINSLFATKQNKGYNKMEAYLKREAETKKEIGSTVSLNKIKINYNKENGEKGFISFSIWVKCDSPSTAARVETEYPQFHDAIISRIQSVDERKITTESGKKEIQAEMLLAMNSVLNYGKIEKIYFHNMVFE